VNTSDYPDTLGYMNNLAFTWEGHGRDTEALKLIKECVILQTRILGTSHPRTLSSDGRERNRRLVPQPIKILVYNDIVGQNG
jgi:hypothetical protein